MQNATSEAARELERLAERTAQRGHDGDNHASRAWGMAAAQMERGDREFTKADLVAILARLQGVAIDAEATAHMFQGLVVPELRAMIRLATLNDVAPFALAPAPAPALAPAPSAPLALADAAALVASAPPLDSHERRNSEEDPCEAMEPGKALGAVCAVRAVDAVDAVDAFETKLANK